MPSAIHASSVVSQGSTRGTKRFAKPRLGLSAAKVLAFAGAAPMTADLQCQRLFLSKVHLRLD